MSDTIPTSPVLHIIKDALIASISANTTKKQPDLTGRQLGVFLSVYITEPAGGHTVRHLAAELNVAKPAITRAVDRIQELGLAKRKSDPNDRRSVLIERTAKGITYLKSFNGFVEKAQKQRAA